MKMTRWMGMATAALMCALAGAAAPGEGATGMAEEFSIKTISVDGKESKYAVFVPKGYSADKTWPLIVFLHGAGERGDDGIAQTQAGIGPAIVRNPERFPAIVLLPLCPKET